MESTIYFTFQLTSFIYLYNSTLYSCLSNRRCDLYLVQACVIMKNEERSLLFLFVYI